MLPPLEEIKNVIAQTVPGATLTVEGTALIVEARDLMAVCHRLKEDERFSLDYLADLTAVDYPAEHLPAEASLAAGQVGAQAGRIDVVYHFYSMAQKHGPLTLKVKLPRANPTVASVTPIWRGAEFQEREAYDLFGVIFEGHPDLRRILMWDGFEGHPMRKDYVVEDQDASERSR